MYYRKRKTLKCSENRASVPNESIREPSRCDLPVEREGQRNVLSNAGESTAKKDRETVTNTVCLAHGTRAGGAGDKTLKTGARVMERRDRNLNFRFHV